MECNDTIIQSTSPQVQLSSQVIVGDGIDEGFENFFNNESLSDRILHICETEKVEYYSGGTECNRRGKRCHEEAFDELETSLIQRPIKQEILEEENMIGCSRYPDRDLRESCDSVDHSHIMPNIKVEEDYDEVEQVNVDVVEIITPLNTDESQSEDPQTNINEETETVLEDELTTKDERADLVATCSTTSPEMPTGDTVNVENIEASLRSVGETQPDTTTIEQRVVTTEGEEEKEDGGQPTAQVCTNECIQQQSEITPLPTRTYTLEKKVLRETRVFVHSIILAAKSDFFKCLFSTSGMKETRQQEVRLEVGRNETDTMLIMLRCFYNRNFINHQSLDVVINVCSLSMKYCFDGLIDKCLEVLASRASGITDIEDFNRINRMVGKIQTDLHQHKGKCGQVLKKFHTFLVKTFSNLDECLEVVPCKLFQLRLEAMHLFIDPYVQGGLSSPHGNLFLYAMQRWVRNHQLMFNLNSDDPSSVQIKKDTFNFIQKLLNSVSLSNVTSDFLTNVMNYEISPFNIWPGYKDWYIRALQNHIYQTVSRTPGIKNYPILNRQREMKYARQEKNADIFSMSPVILNGFEIGIYLRVREDRKLHMLCKCKNLLLNKVGFDKAVLTFTIKGMLKLNTNSTLWKEPFPRQFTSHPAASMFTDRFAFSYKQNTMCLQMYSLCRLSPAVYNIAKRNGFLIEFEIQYIN